MPRSLRINKGDIIYHVINRANARSQIFDTLYDYLLFEEVLSQAKKKTGMRILAYCVMPNHFHLILYPKKDGDLSKFMNWLTMTHTQRWHALHKSVGTGHLYQGRYKSFVIETDAYFLQACLYVERNPLRANLVTQAEDWRYGSLWRREKGSQEQKALLDNWPIEMPSNYLEQLNVEKDEKLEKIRTCVNRGQPFGSDPWVEKTIKSFGQESTIRARGRPKKGS